METLHRYRPLTIGLIFSFWIAVIAGISVYVDNNHKPYEPEVFYVEDPAVIEQILPTLKYTKTVPGKQAQDEIHVTSTDVIFISERERTCLIRNVFFEAGAEPYFGKIAVAQVTWNRLKEGKWGNDICKVVYAPSQFSWTVDSRKRNAKVDTTLWVDSIQAVDDFINGTRIVRLENSLFFHASHVRPNWHGFAERIKQIGNHVFYALK